jgi:hypothetical protein
MSPAVIELTVPGIARGKRRTNIESDLAAEPGIQQVTADASAQRARVACAERRP